MARVEQGFRRQRMTRVLAVPVAAMLAAIAALASVPSTRADPGAIALPIVIGGALTACDETRGATTWPTATRVIIPIGGRCPAAAEWLAASSGKGADPAEHEPESEADMIDWILHPADRAIDVPAWHAVRERPRRGELVDVERALNSWAGQVVGLPVADAWGATGGDRQAYIVRVARFRLDRAYLVDPGGACRAAHPANSDTASAARGGQGSTCLVGTFLAPDDPPATIDPPSPPPAASPTGSLGEPSSQPESSSAPSPSNGEIPTGTGPATSGSPSPDPSSALDPGSDRGSPAPRVVPAADPTTPPPPASYLRIGAPTALSIPLHRDATNAGSLQLFVDSDGSWTLSVRDPRNDVAGFMTNDGSGRPLGAPMSAAVVPGEAISLAGAGGRLTTGVGASSVTVTVYQQIGPRDEPGTYGIALLFVAVAGF